MMPGYGGRRQPLSGIRDPIGAGLRIRASIGLLPRARAV